MSELTREQVLAKLLAYVNRDLEPETRYDLREGILDHDALQRTQLDTLRWQLAAQEVQMAAVRYRAEQAEQQLAEARGEVERLRAERTDQALTKDFADLTTYCRDNHVHMDFLHQLQADRDALQAKYREMEQHHKDCEEVNT